MPPTPSTMLPLGTAAPPFRLPSTDGKIVSDTDYADAKGLLVIFACNHCPFVIHVKDEIARIADNYMTQGVAVVAINPNDADEYPDDSFENMKERAIEWRWKFPYLHDESQEVARAYRAACTPDFFLFDADRILVYRGQLDDSRPNNGLPVNGADLRHALEALLVGEKPTWEQKPSIGCSIKWKPGNAPPYAM